MDGRNLSELYTPVSHYKQEGPKNRTLGAND